MLDLIIFFEILIHNYFNMNQFWFIVQDLFFMLGLHY